MTALPSPSQVALSQEPLYEHFYKQVDPAGTDRVEAVEAAAFLKRSGLSDAVLSKIWDMSDPQGKGYLDKKGFFVALKLIALSQNGKDLTMMNLALECPAPHLKAMSGRTSPAIDWTIKLSERKKYEEMFYSMSPVNGKLPGDKVKPVMLNSKLPVDILGKIWDLSDTDQDGFLSKEEFILAMHLIYKALENIPVPSVLPPELAILIRKKSATGSITGVPVLPDVLPPTVDGATVGRIRRSSTPSSDYGGRNQPWIVSAAEKAKYDDVFITLDGDVDGYVTGTDIKDTFLQSGLPQSVLAHIWNLCDIKQSGKLNSEQFALAMHLVQQKLRGMELPATTLPEMVPPSLRPKSSVEMDNSPLVLPGENESTGSKELDMISNEIKEIQMEKMALEKDLAQKEADVKIKNGELKNCQNELDALESMLKQLEMQKGEAGKRLNDLDNQKSSVDQTLAETIASMEDELKQIELLKKQKEEQKANLETQEQELKAKRQELNDMKQEEERLETQIHESKANLDALTNNLQSTQLQISQLKLKIDQVNEQYQLMTDGIAKMDAALSNGDCSSVPDYILNGISPIHEADINAFVSGVDSPKVQAEVNGPVADDFQEDPFKNKDPFKEMNGFVSDPFADEDPFKSADPFKDGGITAAEDPFAADPFQEPFGAAQPESTADPFQGNDPFGSFPASTTKAVNDPFDPFGLGSNNAASESPVKESDNVDPFGADPFGAQPAAPLRPASPTPALPPKKSKAPPPRPAPPKLGASGTKPAPTRAAPAPPVPPAPDPFKVAEAEAAKSNQGFGDLFSPETTKQDPFDPFGSKPSGSTQDNFANFDNFADFDNIK